MIHASYIISPEDETYGDLYLYKNDYNCSYFECRSGPYGKGVLPRGLYEIVSCYIPEDQSKDSPYRGDSFAWMAGIIPQFETERNNLAIHGKGKIPGTLGCIEISKWDLYAHADIKYMLDTHKILNLEVR